MRRGIGGIPQKPPSHIAKEFEFSQPIVTPKLLKKRTEMDEANERLGDAKQKFESWKLDFQKQKHEIEGKQEKLEQQKTKFHEFALHHRSELDKARQKERGMLERMRTIEKMISDLKEKDDSLKERNDYLRVELDKLQPCADYLQRVVDISTNYDSIETILNRYHSIYETREEYLTKYRRLLECFGNNSKKQRALIELRKAYIIDKTVKYQQGIAKMKNDAQQSEYKKISLIKDIQRIEEKIVELSSIKTSIRSIYERSMDRIVGPDQKRSNSDDVTEEQMLTAIKNRFSDLLEIIKESKIDISE